MPNGTYGGVRGEAGDGFTYSIVQSNLEGCADLHSARVRRNSFRQYGYQALDINERFSLSKLFD